MNYSVLAIYNGAGGAIAGLIGDVTDVVASTWTSTDANQVTLSGASAIKVGSTQYWIPYAHLSTAGYIEMGDQGDWDHLLP